MAAVVGLRAMARGDNFQLSTNKPGCGNLDDLVYTTGTGQYYLQLKHTDNPDTTNLVHSDLVPLLHQCFESYCQIIQGSTFKDIPVHRSEFIIYTNKQLGPKLSQHSRQQRAIDVIFKTCGTGEVFNFTPDKNKQTDVYTLVGNKVKETEEFRDLNSRDQDCKLNMISEFLKKLIMVTGQKGQDELDAIIVEEIRKQDVAKVGLEVYERELLYLKTSLETWWRNKKEIMTSEVIRSWLQNAKTESCLSVVRSLFTMSTKMFVGTGIKFSDIEITGLRAELANKCAVYLRSYALTLSSTLLLNCLDTSKCIFVNFECLQSHTDELFHAWLGGVWEWLIVSCDSTVGEPHISETCKTFSEIIKHAPLNKCVIILSSLQQIRDFPLIEHKFSFEQLSKESQEMVLDKKIDFQGCEVTMRSVLQRHGNVENVLGPELVTDLVTGETPVNIGGKLHVNTGYYAPRVLKMTIYLQLNALKKTDSRPDIFAVSGIKTRDLLKIVASGETVGNLYVCVYSGKEIYNAGKSSRFIVMYSGDLEACFLKLCEKHSQKTLHWVEFNNGDLLWKMSRGDTDSLLDYVDAEKTRAGKRIIREYTKNCKGRINEDLIWDLNQRTVLVVAEPGMGKSTSTTHLAWNKKLADPTSWVLQINWNENSRKLEEINTETCNVDTIVQFFSSAVFSGSKYYNLSTILLKQALEVSGNITILTNGYDQISPRNADKADFILSALRKTRVAGISVMSCPVARERLEKRLAVEALHLEPLSNLSQEQILLNLWKSKYNSNTDQTRFIDFIKGLLSQTPKLVNGSSFTGSPLFITMIATAFELNVEAGDFSTPKHLDLVYLYGRFLKRGLHNYQIEKKKEGVQGNHEMTRNFLKNVEGCALVDTLPPSTLKSLHDKEIEEDIKPFVPEVLTGKYKTGLAITALEGRPHFVRPEFAQCLTARWFSKYFESNRSVLENILFKNSYKVMKAEFDMILASGSELHSAVLDLNFNRVENLLQAGSDANARDRGGRTVMHLYAAQGDDTPWWTEDITDSFLEHGACLCDRDNVLQWTPLRYAIQSGAWLFVEQLLKHNVDRKDMEVIINRVHDSYYIGEIVEGAIQQDCILLMQFLKSIGVDMDRLFTGCQKTPLHFAVENKQLRIMRWLIEQGAHCDNSGWDDETPLIQAARHGFIDAVRILVEEGHAPLNARDSVGRTALDWAIIQAAGGPDSYSFNDEDSDGRIGAEAVVKYLRERGCEESDIPDGIVHEMITGLTNLSMGATQ